MTRQRSKRDSRCYGRGSRSAVRTSEVGPCEKMYQAAKANDGMKAADSREFPRNRSKASVLNFSNCGGIVIRKAPPILTSHFY